MAMTETLGSDVVYAEYLFLDGSTPTQEIRSKTRLIPYNNQDIDLSFFPEWSYDGSSTYQSDGKDSDLVLQPVNFCQDSYRRRDKAFLVICEVLNPDGSPHSTNQRARLRNLWNRGAFATDTWVGFEQEYTLFEGSQPLGWPEKGDFPVAQGPFYCGVGSDKIFGRDLVEEHMSVCEEAGLSIFGINAEVMPGQWEFQIGYRGEKEKKGDKVYRFSPELNRWILSYRKQNLRSLYNPLNMSDELWMARWFLHRIAEDHEVRVSFENKPKEGDWNGAGMHTNFSTEKLAQKEVV